MDAQAVEQLQRRHSFQEWHDRNTLDESLFIYNFLLTEDLLPGWRRQRLQRLTLEGMPPLLRSIWQDAGGASDLLLKIDAYNGASRSAAHALLLQLVGNFQSALVERQPELDLGDVAFSQPGDAVVVFARANLVFFMASVGDRLAPVESLARQLDAKLIERPEGAASGARSVLMRELRVPASVSVGTALPLAVDLKVADAAEVSWKFFSQRGDVVLEGDKLLFQARQPGEAEISAFASRAQAPVRHRRLRLRVEGPSR